MTADRKSIRVAMFVINNMVNDARVLREASTLAENGFRVMVIALNDARTPAEEVVGNFTVKRVRVSTRPLPRMPLFQLVKYLEFIIRAVLVAVRFKARVCHGHDLNGLLPAYLAACLLRARLVYDSHELATHRNINRRVLWGETRLWFYMERWLIKKAHLVITVSPAIAAELARLYGIDPPAVIMNCPPYCDVPRNDILLEHFGLARSDIIVIYHGVFAPNRGIEKLIESMSYLPDSYRLVLLGPDNPYKEGLKELASRLGLAGRVYHHDAVPVDDVVRYVASADVGTFLSDPRIKSHLLGLPNKLFECMAAGTPVVVGVICSEFVRELAIGVSCDQDEPVSLAGAIRGLVCDREFYLHAQENARRHAREEYNWQVQGEKLCRLYREMPGTTNSSAA